MPTKEKADACVPLDYHKYHSLEMTLKRFLLIWWLFPISLYFVSALYVLGPFIFKFFRRDRK